jgi:hypothetical protein
MPDGMISPREPTPPGLGQVAPYEPADTPHARCRCGAYPPDAAHMCEQNPDQYGFESVRVMRLQPGDTIALHVKDHLTNMARAVLHDQLKRTFPDHETIIVDGGAELSIARPDADLGSVKPNPETTKDGDQS